jgi:hypothetical protein
MNPASQDPATVEFSINFDYRCPFARNGNEHVVTALQAGAPWTVHFAPFSLTQVHVGDGEPAAWDQPDKRSELVAVAAGLVVRERFPDSFLSAHVELFRARHDEHGDLRDDRVVRLALDRGGVDPDAVYAELAAGWPFALLASEHEKAVAEHDVFGVPTFVTGGAAAFVRVMTRPDGDAELARRTIGRVLDLLIAAPELNEVKHTTVPR